jgi:hypothetical protein
LAEDEREVGEHVITVCITDEYSSVQCKKVNVQVVNPSAGSVPGAENAKSKGGIGKNNYEDYKGVVKQQKIYSRLILLEVRRDSTALLKISSLSQFRGQLALKASNETFKISLKGVNGNEILSKIPYSILSVDEDRSLITLQL